MDPLDNKIIFLLIAIIAVWILINPKSRDYIKAATGKVFTAPAAE